MYKRIVKETVRNIRIQKNDNEFQQYNHKRNVNSKKVSLILFNARIREEIYSGIKYDEFIEKLTGKLRDRESRRVNERIYESFIEDL